MKNFVLSLYAVLASITLSAQTPKEKLIVKIGNQISQGIKPHTLGVDIPKFENDYRAAVWSDLLSQAYLYNNDKVSQLGYEFIKKNIDDYAHRSFIYRNCKQGIILEITEWYGVKLVISLEWYAPNVRKSIGYLMWCADVLNTIDEVSDQQRKVNEKMAKMLSEPYNLKEDSNQYKNFEKDVATNMLLKLLDNEYEANAYTDTSYENYDCMSRYKKLNDGQAGDSVLVELNICRNGEVKIQMKTLKGRELEKLKDCVPKYKFPRGEGVYANFLLDINVSKGVTLIKNGNVVNFLENTPKNEFIRKKIQLAAEYQKRGKWLVMYKIGRINSTVFEKILFFKQ